MSNFNPPDFDVMLLDELIASNDFVRLKKELLFILKHCSGIDWIFLLDKYIFAFPEDEIIKTPQFVTFAAVSASIKGDIGKAQEYAQLLDKNLLLSHYITVYMPLTDNKTFRKSIEYLINTDDFLASFSSCRPSIINGIRDFSCYGRFLEYMEKPLKDFLFSLYGHDSYGMYEVALAEYYYQINRCYDALTCVDSVLRVLQQRGNPAVLQAALFVQINVLVSKGQVKNLQVLVDDFEAKIQKINYTLYPTYIGAMRAWCSIYEGDSEAGEKWLKNHTFSDSDAVSIMDIFDIIVMLRINIQLGKYYLVASTAVRLMPILKSWHREMDLCNVKLLYALALFSDHNYEKAYTVLDETLPVVKRRRYYRLVSDEGEKMYHMLRLYVKDRDISDNCLDRLITMAKETGIMYPNYLRRSSENYPTLTETEKNVLRLMSAERTNAEIADYMSVSINTIKFHSKNIFMKLNASNRHQAIRIATQANII